MTTVTTIIASARAKLATMAPTRDGTLRFLEHKTNQPFERSPHAKADGFDVVARDEKTSEGFGQAGRKEEQFFLVVRLGHCPASTDDVREGWRARDRARIADVLERHTWPAGTMAVFYDHETCDKESANWWLTEMFFRVMYNGTIEAS